jgi:hypothetical protein
MPRELDQVMPTPKTELEILWFGLYEIAALAPGGHLSDPCYGARRELKEYARRILDAAEAAK